MPDRFGQLHHTLCNPRSIATAGESAVELSTPANKPLHKRCGRTVVDILGTADLLDPSSVEHGNPVGQRKGVVLIMGHQHHG